MIIIKALAACLMILPLQATATDVEPPLPGYTVEDVNWSLEVFPGQGVQNFTGTIQEVHSQIKRLNPRWIPPAAPLSQHAEELIAHHDADDHSNGTAIEGNDNSTETGLARRAPPRKAVLNTRCSRIPFNWGLAKTDKIMDGVRHLLGITTGYQPQNKPKGCGRVSCSYKSAIWWCNDDPKNYKRIPNWDPIVLGIFTILDKCSGDREKGKVAGQCYVENDWVVVLRSSSC